MSIVDTMAEKILATVLGKLFTKIRGSLVGKKSYITIILGLIGTISGYLNGNITADQAAGAIWVALMFLFQRIASANVAAQVTSVQNKQ